jgi:hypothetical protein
MSRVFVRPHPATTNVSPDGPYGSLMLGKQAGQICFFVTSLRLCRKLDASTYINNNSS